ncbi:MAG: hypothetical protein NT084_10620 [Bacteroidetes bacterium]|nr:hypothetical protein [Bacteroidota bacterium]
MPLTVNANPIVLSRLSFLDFSQYSSFQTVVAHAKNPLVLNYNVYKLKVLPFGSTPEAFFSALDVTYDVDGVSISENHSGLRTITIKNFNSRRFDIIYVQSSNPYTVDVAKKLTEVIDYSYTNSALIGANGSFFNEKAPADPWPLSGKAYSGGQEVSYPVQTDLSFQGYVAWDPSTGLTFGVGDYGNGNGNAPSTSYNAFSAVIPLVFNNALNVKGTNYVNSAQYGGYIPSSLHLVAYNSVKDVLFIIATDRVLFDPEIYGNLLIGYGFENAFFMDGGASVYLWDYRGKGKGSLILKDSLFDSSERDKHLHLGYGIY